jgi:16S rRNA (cytosine967-C5)-methyltransferase
MTFARVKDPKLTAASLTRTVLDQSLFINELLNDTLSSFDYNQRRFITELVYGTVRNMKHLDFWIFKAFKKPLKRIDPELLSIIRISLYQIIFMSNKEDHSVVNEAAELAKKCGGEKTAGFVNFILREILRLDPSKENMEKFFKNHNDKFLQTYYSVPEWLFNRMKKLMPAEPVETYLEIINRPLGITLRVEGDESSREKVIELLTAKGAAAEKAQDCPYGVYTSKAVNFDMIKDIEGVFIQDESSQLAVCEMEIEKGERILDLCAAPGGKTLFASYLTGKNGKVVAVDINRHRLNLLAEAAVRHKRENIEVKLHDGSVPRPEWVEGFDKVLIDAPCSALGTMRRHPEIKWLKKDHDPEKMAGLAGMILDVSASYVKKDGVLLFAVCTFTKEETTDQIQKFLLKHTSFKTEKAYYTVSSAHDNRDTFFICKMRKIK